MSSNGWETFKVGEIGKVITGKTPPTQNPNNFGDKYPFITPRDMLGQKRIYKTERYLSEEGKNTVKNCLLPAKAVCVSCIGSDMGKVVMTTKDSVTNQQLNSVICEDSFDPDFVYYGLVNISNELKNVGHHSTAVPILNKNDFSNFEILAPPFPTQRRIADILSALDDKIELNRQTNATLETMAQAIFTEWFVDFNFPGATGEMVKSELGLIPKGWRVLPLDEIADFLNGLALQKYPPVNDAEYLPVIKIREMRNGITSSTDKASRNIPDKYIVRDGDLLFSWSGSLEVKFWVGGEGALNQHLFKVTSKDYPLWFCYFWLLYHLEEFRKIAEDKTTTMGHIQRGHLSVALCLVPDSLDRMDRIINSIIEKIISNEMESSTLSNLRNDLLPKLISGEIEV
jgi:type I restriction enzyme S subunit